MIEENPTDLMLTIAHSTKDIDNARLIIEILEKEVEREVEHFYELFSEKENMSSIDNNIVKIFEKSRFTKKRFNDIYSLDICRNIEKIFCLNNEIKRLGKYISKRIEKINEEFLKIRNQLISLNDYL